MIFCFAIRKTHIKSRRGGGGIIPQILLGVAILRVQEGEHKNQIKKKIKN